MSTLKPRHLSGRFDIDDRGMVRGVHSPRMESVGFRCFRCKGAEVQRCGGGEQWRERVR